MAMVETIVVVRYQETDQMGVAHHSAYPVWFEVARSDLVKAYGYTYSGLEARGLMMPLISLSCEFKGYCRYEDVVSIRAWVRALTGTRMTFGYEARKRLADGAPPLVARGETVHVFADRRLKPVNLKKYMPEAYAAFSAGIGGEGIGDKGTNDGGMREGGMREGG